MQGRRLCTVQVPQALDPRGRGEVRAHLMHTLTSSQVTLCHTEKQGSWAVTRRNGPLGRESLQHFAAGISLFSIELSQTCLSIMLRY